MDASDYRAAQRPVLRRHDLRGRRAGQQRLGYGGRVQARSHALRRVHRRQAWKVRVRHAMARRVLLLCSVTCIMRLYVYVWSSRGGGFAASVNASGEPRLHSQSHHGTPLWTSCRGPSGKINVCNGSNVCNVSNVELVLLFCISAYGCMSYYEYGIIYIYIQATAANSKP